MGNSKQLTAKYNALSRKAYNLRVRDTLDIEIEALTSLKYSTSDVKRFDAIQSIQDIKELKRQKVEETIREIDAELFRRYESTVLYTQPTIGRQVC